MMVTSKPFSPMSSALCDSVVCRRMIQASVTRCSMQDQHAQHDDGNPDQSEFSRIFAEEALWAAFLSPAVQPALP